jgi:hypothetical protein
MLQPRWVALFAIALIVLILALAFAPRSASATPIFAQRYGFKCSVCHTVVPELNAYGDQFRRAGFNIPGAARHGYFPLVLRFQESYVKELLPSQTRRFNALAILASTANFGKDNSFSYYARYFFGSQGAPGSLYYAYAQQVNQHSGAFERFGLYNLPLIQNATQRLDDLTPQPVYTYTVGQNSANFVTPRWGGEVGQRNDRVDVEAALSFDEYHGAAYGVPAPPSEFNQHFVGPEFFASATAQVVPGASAGGLFLTGTRTFQSRVTGFAYDDHYDREGVQAAYWSPHFAAYAQQIWGSDSNADGLGHVQASSGGFVTLKYRPTPHTYLGIRYDAVADPFARRDFVYYVGLAPFTMHARLVFERLQPVGAGNPLTSAQLLIALPFERKGATGPK